MSFDAYTTDRQRTCPRCGVRRLINERKDTNIHRLCKDCYSSLNTIQRKKWQ